MKKLIVMGLFAASLLGSFDVGAQHSLSTADQYFMMGSYDKAADQYVTIVDANPNDRTALAKLINTYKKMGRIDDIYDRLSTRTPSSLSSETILIQGHTCKMLGKFDEAKIWYKAYREHDQFVAQHYYESCDFAKKEMRRTPLYDVDPLNSNSPASEYGAELFNGSLVFASHRSDIKRTEKRKEQNANQGKSQLYIADMSTKTELTDLRFLRSDIKAVFGEGPVSYSEDGRIAAIMKSDTKAEGSSLIDGDEKTLSIYLAIVDQAGDWTLAEPFPFNSTSYSNAWPFLMNGGKTLYFASNRPDGYGGYDIYMSHRVKGEWTLPTNLGPHINTGGNEITPYLSNGNLFFASDYHFGFGGYDLYRGEIRNGDYKQVYHLGKDINSPYNDYGFVTQSDAQHGYFTSDRSGGQGAEDIYYCNKVSGQVVLTVTDAFNSTSVSNAQVTVLQDGSVFHTDRSGKCSINLRGGQSVDLQVNMIGYKSNTITVLADTKAVSSKNYTLTLTPDGSPKASASTILSDNSSDIIQSATDQLNHPKTSPVIINSTNDAYADVQRTSNGTPLRRPVQNPVSEKQNVNNSSSVVKSNVATTSSHAFPTKHRVSTTATTSNGTPLRRPVTTTAKQKPPTSTAESSAMRTIHTSSSALYSANAENKPVNYEEKYSTKVFAIQLASFNEVQTMNAEMNPFKRLYDLGGLYKSKSNGITKVKLGTYATEAEVRSALNEVKLRGFKDAFLIHEQESLPLEASPIITAENRASFTEATQTSPTMPVRNTVVNRTNPLVERISEMRELSDGYKIRLGAFREFSYFKSSTYEDLGYAEMEMKDPYTIVYLAGLADYASAKIALDKIKRRGYPDAYVIVRKNSVISKIQ